MNKASDVSGCLIEIVDESTTFRKILRQVMEANGFLVCEACNGQEAIDVFDRESPALVLMAYELSVVNGIDACKEIRKIDRNEYSPVIMITAKEDDDFIQRVFAAGAADYIVKPVPWEVLVHRISYMLHMSKAVYAMESSEKRFRQLFDDSPLPYQSLNEHGDIVDVNKAWLNMMGQEESDVVGKSFGEFMHAKQWHTFLSAFPGFIKSGELSNMQLQVIGKNGECIDVEMNGRVAYDIQGNFKQTHGTLQNITERKALEEKLRFMATTDSLTGLHNRRSFFDLADRERLKSMRFKHDYSAMMLDIDHFKAINDTYGHDIGDEVLKFFATTIEQCLRDIDILGRLGGEEFAVILPETCLSDAVDIAERIRAKVDASVIDTSKGPIEVKVSIGVTSLSDAQESNHDLMKQADELLYRAKENGRNRVEQ